MLYDIPDAALRPASPPGRLLAACPILHVVCVYYTASYIHTTIYLLPILYCIHLLL